METNGIATFGTVDFFGVPDDSAFVVVETSMAAAACCCCCCCKCAQTSEPTIIIA